MSEHPPLTPRDYDPWALASPEELLAFCVKLGVSGSDIGRWLRVPQSSVSMWLTGARRVPRKHVDALRERTRLAFDQNAELMTKAVALAPTEDLRNTLRRDFDTVYLEWKSHVLSQAGTLWRANQRDAETLMLIAGKTQYTREDVETVRLLSETLAQRMEVLIAHEGEASNPDDELIARLTAAHTAAPPVRLTAEERAKAEADRADRLPDDDAAHETARTTNPPEPES